MPDFAHSFAVIIGINRYENGIPTLKTAVNDARALADFLKKKHGYEPLCFVDQDATLAGLTALLTKDLPALVGGDDRVLFYFAGHGVALDGDDGPSGFILPQDARRDSAASFLPMPAVHDALCALQCRHLLAILDCCFAGAFRWSSVRDVMPLPTVLHQERYERFIRDPAWQVISSAAQDQRALDVLAGRAIGQRDAGDAEHSPFAELLLKGLAGAGDVMPGNGGDGVITATELYVYLDHALDEMTENRAVRQTPRLWPLRKDDKGQFIFLTPDRPLALPPAPPLTDANNPYRGLQAYEEAHKDLFFGRERVVRALETTVLQSPVTIVLGPTGTGKSSLVKAGLVPSLRSQDWEILPIVRPGISPQMSSAEADFALRNAPPDRHLVLVVDQLEELVTMCRDDAERDQFLKWLAGAVQARPQGLRVVMTLRSDFEPQIAVGTVATSPSIARFVVPAMTQDELRDVIEKPASERVLYFKPPELVERLINEVVQTPGALALLSFTLREMYVKYVERHGDDRALTTEDYEALGGVVGALRHRATEEYVKLDAAEQLTMRRLMLRMVSVEAGDVARRRVQLSELQYPDAAETDRVKSVIGRLDTTRLVTQGLEDAKPYVEPAHDELIRGWDKLWEWIRAERKRPDSLRFQRRVTRAAEEWNAAPEKKGRAGFLWLDAARISVLQQAVGSSDPWLNDTESRFVGECIKSSRRRRTTAFVIGGLFALAMALIGLAGLFALQNQGTALSRQLAAQALSEMPNRLDRALLLAVQANQVRKTSEARSSLFAALQYSPHLSAVLVPHGSAISTVAISPGGQLAASGRSNTVMVWNLDTHHATGWKIPLPGRVWALAFSPSDGKTLAVGSGSRTVTFWDVASGHLLGPQPSPTDTGSTGLSYSQKRIAFSPDGRTLASARGDSTVILWDVLSHREQEQLRVPAITYACLAYNRDGTRLAIGGEGGTLLYDLSRKVGQRYEMFRESQNNVMTLAFSPRGNRLATSSLDQTIVLWDVETKRSIDTMPTQGGTLSGLAFDASGDTLYGASSVESISRWSLETGHVLEPLGGHGAGVTDLAISQDGKRMVSGGFDGTLLAWDLESAPSLGRVLHGVGPVKSVAFSPDGRYLATRNEDSTVTVMDTRRGNARQTFATGLGPKGGIAFSRDGQTLVLSGDSGVAAFDLAHVPSRAHLSRSPESVGERPIEFDNEWESGGTAFSPDGKLLAAGSRSLMLWRVAAADSFEPVASIVGATSDVAYSPRGDLIAVADQDQWLHLWQVAHLAAPGPIKLMSRRPGSTFGSHPLLVHLAFSPDARLLAVGKANEGIVTFWDVAHRVVKDPLVILPTGIGSLRFDPDGSLLAAGLSDNGLALIDPALRQPLGSPLRAPDGDAHAIAFSPDGKTLAAGGWGRSLILWDVGLQTWIDRACTIANDASGSEWQAMVSRNSWIDKVLKPASGCPAASARH
jgi:WD40 repeat protein